METRSLQRWAFVLACATVLALALSGPASAQRHGGGWHGGGGGWHGGGWHGGGWHGGWHGGGYRGYWHHGWGWGWSGMYVVPRPYNYCTYASCYPYWQPPYYPYYAYPPPYYGY